MRGALWDRRVKRGGGGGGAGSDKWEEEKENQDSKHTLDEKNGSH